MLSDHLCLCVTEPQIQCWCLQMLKRESNMENNIEKALRDGKINACKEAAREAAEKEAMPDAADLQQVWS